MRKKREIKINSGIDQIPRVEAFIEEIAFQYNLNDSYFGNMLIAVTEAVRNAIIHGNNNQYEKEILVNCRSEKAGLVFSVLNQGDGFNFTQYLDPEKLLESDDDNKRGMLLIHTLSDSIKFTDRGRCIDIIFKITGIDSVIVEKRQSLMSIYFHEQKKILNQ